MRVCVTVPLGCDRGLPQAFPAQFKFTSEMKHVASDLIIFRRRCLPRLPPQQLPQNDATIAAWDLICLDKYLRFNRFTAPLCYDLILARLHSNSRLLPRVFSPSDSECGLQMRVTRCPFYPTFSSLPALLSSPLPLLLSSPSLTASFCDCSACPLGLKQTSPLLQKRKLI